MRRRFRRKHRTPHGGGQSVSRSRFGLLWVILAVVVLAAVIGYDRYGINQAQQHISQARAYERSGLYSEALKEYKMALANKRLGRRPKAEVALEIGNIYYDHFENYDMAHGFFVQARQNAPKLFEKQSLQERLKTAQRRSAGATPRMQDGVTTETVTQRVQLMSQPQEDLRGPVVARFEGGEIRAGELHRVLKETGEYNEPGFREDPAKLEQFLKRHLSRVIKYQAGLDAGLHRDPDVSARLYDYQRTLISERYARQERQQAQRISKEAVREYYEKNRGQYVRQAAANIAMIKTETQAAAEEALGQLRQGKSFADVATSASRHEESARKGGLVGRITQGDKEIPGVGSDPELVQALLGMKANSITGVTPSNGSFFIFRVVSTSPAHITTLDEARPQIELTLRGRQVDAATGGLDKQLAEEYKPELVQEGVRRFWQFALGSDGSTTETASSTTSTATALFPTTGSTVTTSTAQSS